MVRITLMLFRTPVIKFRKGGLGRPAAASGAPAAAPAAAPPGSSSASCILSRAQPAATMSTQCSIPDIDLPAKYRRAPLSQEEIDKINGGGIV